MFQVITGGSGSGKSQYAECCIMNYHRDSQTDGLFYLATMEPFGKEMEEKITRHKKMRDGKDFFTIECYRNLELAIEQIQNRSIRSSVLLECMSNLTANEFYEKVLEQEKGVDLVEEHIEQEVADKIICAVRRLKACCINLVVVTNEVCSSGEKVSKEMEQYKRILSHINRQMVAEAHKVTEVVYGIPIEYEVKG